MTKSPPGIHAEDVKASLRKQFGPITLLSERWGFHRSGISNALRDPAYSVRIERQIAEALGLSPHEIWPDRYAADGTSLPRRPCNRSSHRPTPETSQKRRAA
jgi:Ner family transcriptional regulator